jgi:hypothetical protein
MVIWQIWRNPLSVSRAKRNIQGAEIGWLTYERRILSTAGKECAIIVFVSTLATREQTNLNSC